MTVIPFAFIRYGDRIRVNSSFCQELRARKERAEREAQREVERGELRPEAKEEKLETEMILQTAMPVV